MKPLDTSVKTTCPYCGVGCGLLASVDPDGVVTIKGDPDHPANRGRLCSKGSALGETVYLQDRLLYPEAHGEQVSWEHAIAEVAGEFHKVIDKHGPDAVAFYVSGQLLTEDYYAANKLMKGCIGSANIDTNSRLCMASPVAAYKRAFGEDCVPVCYEDIDEADLIVIAGSNTAWCHPVIYQRIVAAKKNNPSLKVVLIDPRRTQTADIANLHLSIAPGTDATLWNGLLVALDDSGRCDEAFTLNSTTGLDEALQAARKSAGSLQNVAETCRLSPSRIETFYSWFLNTEKTVSIYSQGVNQSSSGTDKCNAIINCHLFTGRIGKPGMGPFSITGQPNAMGGREVGGLANQLAAHMSIEDEEHRRVVQEFWQSPAIPQKAGLKAIDLFDAIDDGKVKALWIMATNPVVSMPNADKVKQALDKCDFTVISDCVANTDTARLCDLKLPALTWGERNGTVTNSERCISRQKPFLPAPGLAKPDWWIITQVARKMGYADLFPYNNPAEIFREHAGLSACENEGRRLFDLGAFKEIDGKSYDAFPPVQWPAPSNRPQGTKRIYNDGRFTTEDRRARFIEVEPQLSRSKPQKKYPFTLNTGRVRDHWHTLTRTGVSPRLSSHKFEPYVEIHPKDAEQSGVANGELAQVVSPLGETLLRVEVSERQQRGSLFAPMHWGDEYSAKARIGVLIEPACDPVSGQPESKGSIAALSPYRPKWQGFILTRHLIELSEPGYWTRIRGKGLWRYELGGIDTPEEWSLFARILLNTPDEDNWIDYFDPAAGQYRGARFIDRRLESCIFIGPDSVLPSRDWLTSLFHDEDLSPVDRSSLLAAAPREPVENQGRIICSCHNVGEKAISRAILEGGCDTPEAIGVKLKAGTNCGSCLPEIREMIEKKRKTALVSAPEPCDGSTQMPIAPATD